MKARRGRDENKGEWTKRSFSLVVAPLPSKFIRGQHGIGYGGGGGEDPLVEDEEDRMVSWVPCREQIMMASMPRIRELPSEQEEEEEEEEEGKRARPLLASVFEERGGSATSMCPPPARVGSRSGPVRSKSRFPPRSGGSRMAMTSRPPLGGGRSGGGARSRDDKKKSKSKLFVKGLDLTAG
jgi:hypothetical protein